MLKSIAVSLIFIICLPINYSLRNKDGIDPLIPNYSEFYYYQTIEDKMIESMSINNCTLFGTKMTTEQGGSSWKENSDIEIVMLPPNQNVLKIWKNSDSRLFNNKLFAKATEHLCEIDHYYEFKRGNFKRGRGCFPKYIVVKNERVERINRYGATFHPDHVRCDIPSSTVACANNGKTSKTTYIEVPDKFRSLHQYPFIIKSQNVIIARSGMLALPCGPFGLFSQCEAIPWGVTTAMSVIGNITICRKNKINCLFPIHNRVFILTQYDDTQIGQFLMESLPKLIYNIEYLYANPDIKIHYGFTKKPQLPDSVLPHLYFDWLGLRNRLINGTVYANEIVMPREGGCQDPGYNAWEIVSMREYFFSMLDVSVKLSYRRPNIVIVTRSLLSSFMQNRGDMVGKGKRRWPEGFVTKATALFSELLPSHDVVEFSDINNTLMTCPLCQVECFYNADIVIGMHGAGMSNIMYMRQNGIIVEVVPKFDSRHAPIIGIFPRLASIIGSHHYHYNIEGIKLDVDQFIKDIVNFYRYVKTNAKN